ncbi:MAG TPA: hypothetical protein VFZ26_18055 [Gemmatimonadales bacterium]
MRAGTPISLLGGLAALSLVGCGGDDLLLPSSAAPTQLRLVSGDLQEAHTGTRLPDPLVVEAVDGSGRPVAGTRIVFRFQAATAGAQVSPDTARTDESGRAIAEVRLGREPGAHPVEAILVDGADLRVRFLLTALPPPGNPDGGGGGEGGGSDGGDDDDGFGGGSGGNDGGGGGTGGSGGGDEDDRDGGGRGEDGDDDDDDDDDRERGVDGGDDDDDDEEEGRNEGKGGKGKGDKGKGDKD